MHFSQARLAFIVILSSLASLLALVSTGSWADNSNLGEQANQRQYHSPYIVHAQNLQPVESRPAQSSTTLAANTEPVLNLPPSNLHSEVAYVYDLDTGATLYAKNRYLVRPIASITKLMTAMVVLDANLDLDEMLTIEQADVDTLKHTRSRLRVGAQLSRRDMLWLALMSSENRAASALGRYYPGGLSAFVRAMNEKALALGMRYTLFVEPTGLSSENLSTAPDLAKLLQAAAQYPLIKQFSTSKEHSVQPFAGQTLNYVNTNRLVGNADWQIQVSKTGFINEAGRCLVLHAELNGRKVAIVLLNAYGRYSGMGDANRIRQAFAKQPALVAQAP